MLKNIQALRFYAALAVVIYHSSALFRMLGLEGDVFLYLAGFGDVGIDVFFAISGFVMWYATRNTASDFSASVEFGLRRFYRIFLGYWPAYFIAALIIIFILNRDTQQINWLRSFFLLNPTPFNQVLGVAWTLAYELYFYLLFSLLLLVPGGKRKWTLLFALGLVLSVNLSVKIYQTPFSFVLSPYLMEFLAGAITGAFLANTKSRWLLVIALAVVVVAAYWGTSLPTIGLPRVKGFGTAAAALLLVVVILENARIYSAGPRLVFLGNSSYSLYLLHTPILWCFLRMAHIAGIGDGSVLAYGYFCLALIVIVAVSALNYRFLEAPVYKYALAHWLPFARTEKSMHG